MGEMIDAVDPANIGPSWDHLYALKISVLANPAGQAFDGETGDAGPVAVAGAVRTRFTFGAWSVLYVNEATEGPYCDEIVNNGVPLRDADVWPLAGCYLWCADPSGNIAAGKWVPRVRPVAVQNRYQGTFDLSTTYGPFPFDVAGYIDGPQSQWPADAWARFATLSDVPPAPIRQPGHEVHMFVAETKETPPKAFLLTETGSIYLPDPADLPALLSALGQSQMVPLNPDTVAAFPHLGAGPAS